MINTNDAQVELNKLKGNVIGIFKGIKDAPYELIVGVNDESIDTIHITSFGAIQESYGMPKHYGKIALFPNGKNMNDMLSEPFEWSKFINTNFK